MTENNNKQKKEYDLLIKEYEKNKKQKSVFQKYLLIGGTIGIGMIFLSIPYSFVPLLSFSLIGLYKEYKIEKKAEQLKEKIENYENISKIKEVVNKENDTNTDDIQYKIGDKLYSANELSLTISTFDKNNNETFNSQKTYGKK